LLITSRTIYRRASRTRRERGSRVRLLIAGLLGMAPAAAGAQVGQQPLSLEEARATARRVSPELRAARAAVTAAEARARQAGAFPNPTLGYSHERTSRDDATNAQHVVVVDQPLDVFGQRAARRHAAGLRVAAEQARLDLTQARLDFDVARAFAHAHAGERRAALAREMAEAFTEARRVSNARLAAGDVSGYADRRLRLEAARYAALAAQAALARDSARLALAGLLADSAAGTLHLAAGALAPDAPLLDSGGVAPMVANAPTLPTAARADSLVVLAFARRAELRVAQLDRDAAAAGIRLARSERLPIPVLSAGLKTERTPDGDGFRGFVAGVWLPLPLWDRRQGAVAAAEADTRVLDAHIAALRRQVAREVAEALVASQAVEAQLAELRPRIADDTEAALLAVRVAYAEGEITLVEWLDAVRAYQEAQSTVAVLQAESLIRRAALERAVGVSFPEE
jgi:outer membrane protein, heavy metal efflux system